MTFPVLTTTRLDLIEIKEEYAERLYQTFSLEEVTRYYGMNPLQSVEEASKMVASFNQNFVDRRSIRWGIVITSTGEFIGTLGLNNLQERNKRAEIGYELHPDYWGKGYATEAVVEVLRYGFDGLGLYRIGAVTFPDNLASNQLLLKLGFLQEGVLRGYHYQNNTSHDANIYSLLNKDELTV